MTDAAPKAVTGRAVGVMVLWMVAFAAGVPGWQPALGQQQVDAIVRNGTIFTADDLLSIHHAMAVDGGKIVAVGSNEMVSNYRADCTIDLQGRFVVPGFVDAHTHIRRGR